MEWARFDVSKVAPQGGYLAARCPVRAQWDVVEPAEPAAPSDAALRRMDSGLSHEDAVVARLRQLHPSAVVVVWEDRDERTATTVRAMEDGASIIIGGRLPLDVEGRRVGEPDLLLAARGGGYHPVDVKEHRMLGSRVELPALLADLDEPWWPAETAASEEVPPARKRKADLLQLAHYRRQLEACGWAAPHNGAGIIGTEGVVVWFDLDEAVWRTPSRSEGRKLRSTMEVYDFEFEFRLDVISVAQRHRDGDGSVDLLVVPVRTGECLSCPWWEHCRGQLEASQDISLLPGTGWSWWSRLRDRGVTDLVELAALDASGSDPGLGPLIDLARARLSDAPAHRRRGIDSVGCRRADVEVDLDLENDAAGVYLWGALVTDRSDRSLVEEGYTSFVTWEQQTDAHEHEVFIRMAHWLTSLRSRIRAGGSSFGVYCYYEQAEAGAMRRLCADPATDPELVVQVGELLGSTDWVDLCAVAKSQLITGEGMGLKRVAPLAGFSWEDDDPGGEQSMQWRKWAVTESDPARRAQLRERILTYNRNDVEATKALRDWLDEVSTSLPAIEGASAPKPARAQYPARG